MVSYTNKFPCLGGHEFLLVETGAAAFDAVEVVVDLVGAIEGDVDEGVAGERVEF